MRAQLLKLQKYNSTKSERRIAEILKKNRIKFKCKWLICNMEIDFLIGNVAIEIDGNKHKKSSVIRDTTLVEKGFIPIHVCSDIRDNVFFEKQLLLIIKNNNKNS